MEKIKASIRNFFLDENLYVSALLALLFLSLLVKLEIPVLPHHDDLAHACIGKMILDTGDWLTMHEGALVSFLKPPLYFWAEAVFFKLFGFTDYAARLPAALSGFGTLLLAFFISKRLFGMKEAVATLLVLATSLFFWKYSRKAMLDVPTAFSSALAVYFFIRAEFEKKNGFYLLFGAAAAAGYYFKAIQGLYPLFIFPLYYLATGQFKKLFGPYFLGGYLTAFSLIALWAVPEYLRYGNEFLYSQSALGPIINRGLEGGTNPFFKPLLALMGLNLPWGIFNLYGVWLFASGARTEETGRAKILILAWFFTVMLILSASKTFYIRYLLVAMIPFSIMGGAALAKLLNEKYYDYAKKAVFLFVAVLFLKFSIFPLSPDSDKGTGYAGLYRVINSAGIDPERVAVYKERFYILNNGLSYYSGIIPKRRVKDAKELAETLSPGESYVSHYRDFHELLNDPSLKNRLNLLASDRKNWALFEEKK